VIANPFDAVTFQDQISHGSTFIQLLGVSHPSPQKKELFKSIDLRSVKASADAAKHATAVTGPCHYWPLVLFPLFKILELFPFTAKKAKALRLVSIRQMLLTLLNAVENRPSISPEIIEISRILKKS
jgi:hypothetical protein